MDHHDHVELIRAGVEGATDGPWADLGAGTGAFTLALADLLGPGGQVIAVDRDGADVAEAAHRVRDAFPDVGIVTHATDFTLPMELPPLAGLVLANALHFVARERQVPVLRSLVAQLRPGGRLIVVEYDADTGNQWVPHPFSSQTWERMAPAAGLVRVRRIARVPSRFLGAIYSSVGNRPT